MGATMRRRAGFGKRDFGRSELIKAEQRGLGLSVREEWKLAYR
jgi:hypothetical protein